MSDPAWITLVSGSPQWGPAGQLITTFDSTTTRHLAVDGNAVTPDGLQVDRIVHVDRNGITFEGTFEATSLHVYWYGWGGELEEISKGDGVHMAKAAADTLLLLSRSLDYYGAKVEVIRDGVRIEIDAHSFVHISGNTLASTYLNAESEWQKSFDGTWFTTQDIGEYADGYLQILGRDDEIIISGGENVSLSTIDELLSLHFPDIEAAAFAVPDVEWGHALHLAIVGEIDDLKLSLFLEDTLGVAAKPKKIHRVTSISRIGIGKVDRKALVELLHNE
jgi:acyl-CoA synthetase (AMP-forming)/AMP-acid ligase II